MKVAAANDGRNEAAKTLFQRVVDAKEHSKPEDIEKLEQLLRRREFVPDKTQRQELFEVAGKIGFIDLVQELFGAEYTTWLDVDERNDHDRHLMSKFATGEGQDRDSEAVD